MPIQESKIMKEKAQNSRIGGITTGLKSFNAIAVKAKRQKYGQGYVSPFKRIFASGEIL